MTALMFVLAMVGAARAEEKTCLIKGMECQNCVEMISKDACSADYAVCDVVLKDKKAHLGQIHVRTKDAAGKFDLKRLEAAVAKMDYSVASCADGAPSAESKTKPSAKR